MNKIRVRSIGVMILKKQILSSRIKAYSTIIA